MKICKYLLLFLWLSCWLCSAACTGPQIEGGNVDSPPPATDPWKAPLPAEDATDKYIEGQIGN